MNLYDSIDATLIPRDGSPVAGYGDGAFIWSPSWKAAGGLPAGANWWDLFPGVAQLVIVVSATHSGDVLDVETGDATPAEVPGWVNRFDRPGRRRPTVYSNRGTWPQIVAALQAAGMSAGDVDWWAATLDEVTTSVPGAVAVQYSSGTTTGTGYDVSVIQDPSWVGGDMPLTQADAQLVWANAPDWLGRFLTDVTQEVVNGVRVQSDAGLAARLARVEADAQAIQQQLAQVPPGGGLTAAQAQQLADVTAAVQRLEAALKGA